MPHRFLLRACAAACVAVAAGACDNSPTDPSRPGQYQLIFLGKPQDAESFTPRAVAAGRVVGTARRGNVVWAVQWANGGFSRIGPDVPAECASEPTAARGAFTVGQVVCTAAGDQPTDAYGWAAGVGALPRLLAEPYVFTGINSVAQISGTVRPRAQFPQASQRAILVQGTNVTVLLPPGASSSEAAGISDSSTVAVTGYYGCLADAPDCVPSRVSVWAAGEWAELPIPRNTSAAVAAAVSSAGHVAGYTLGGAEGVFLWDPDDEDLEVLPVVPGTRVQITGANALGQVVGTGIRTPAPGQQASYGIVWGDGRQYALAERVTGTTTRWEVTAALATDDDGRIAGIGVNATTGEEGAILLSPFGRV